MTTSDQFTPDGIVEVVYQGTSEHRFESSIEKE